MYRKLRIQKTRKLRGGQRIPEINRARIRKTLQKKEQIIHCLSQLKRFLECFKSGDTSRMLQFGYNLGRLQELVGETEHPEIWWKPIETSIQTSSWADLESYIEEIRDTLNVEYDSSTIAKGC